MNGKKFLSALVPGIILVTLAATIAARATSTPITDGIVGWWQFNEKSGIVANDSSASSNDGLLSGSAFYTTDATRGSVLKVYGISGRVDYPFTTTLQPATGTISVWVNPSSLMLSDIVQQDSDLLIRCNYAGPFYAYALRMDNRGRAYALISNDDPKTCKRTPQTQVYTGANAIPVGRWTHLVMEWNGATVSLFVNGKAAGSAAYIANPTYGLSYHGPSPMTVAAAGQLGSNYAGQLSDLRVYSRALTTTEITQIYNGQ